MDYKTIWACVGFTGQSLFFSRFLIQWLASERRRRSVIPTAFWFFSLCGGLVLLAYAIHRKDPVFIVGQSAGAFIYTRNLWLIFRTRREENGEPKTLGHPGSGMTASR